MQNIWKITYHNFVVVNFSHKIATFMKKKKTEKKKRKIKINTTNSSETI